MTQRRKLWMTVTAIVLVLALLSSVLLVFADEYIIPEVVPTYEPYATPTPSESSSGAFTTPGNGQVQDHVDSEGSKEFYTVQTHNGNTFYLVIDKERLDDNAYLLSQVDERDLMEFVEEEEVPEETPEVVLEEPVIPEEEKSSGRGLFWTVLLLALAAGGAAFWYFRMVKPNQEEQTIPQSEGMEQPDTGELESFAEWTEEETAEPSPAEENGTAETDTGKGDEET